MISQHEVKSISQRNINGRRNITFYLRRVVNYEDTESYRDLPLTEVPECTPSINSTDNLFRYEVNRTNCNFITCLIYNLNSYSYTMK